MDKMYVRRIVLKSIDADIADRDSIPLISMKVASPMRKVTMITRDNISQRSRDVRYSGNFVFSAIICSTPDLLRILELFPSDLRYKLLSLLKKVNIVGERAHEL
jgi:hypothetical protein